MNTQSPDINEAILKKLRAFHWAGRVLTTVALCVGLLAIAGATLLVYANTRVIFPQVNLLIKEYAAAHANGTNSVAAPTAADETLTLRDGTKLDRQVAVTLMMGKSMDVTSLALTMLGLGTMLTLLLVIFNRRITMRQVNVSLTQISQQIKELQDRGQK